MADIDSELDDLYSQLSSLSKSTKSNPESNSSRLEKIVTKKNINDSFSPNNINRVKSIFTSEINNRRRENKLVSTDFKEKADKQNDLEVGFDHLDLEEINDIETKVRDNLGKKENISGNIFKKIHNNKPSFEIIDKSESAVTILDRDELISKKSLFINNSKRKSGDKPTERGHSNFVNTSAKLLKDNNTFAPLQLKKYSSR